MKNLEHGIRLRKRSLRLIDLIDEKRTRVTVQEAFLVGGEKGMLD